MSRRSNSHLSKNKFTNFVFKLNNFFYFIDFYEMIFPVYTIQSFNCYKMNANKGSVM